MQAENHNVEETVSSANEMHMNYFVTTTVHGVSPIFTSKTFTQRLFWVSLFTSAFGLFAWQVSQLVVKIVGNDVVIKTTTINVEWMPFPQIHVCNANPYIRSRILPFLPTELNASERELQSQSIYHLISNRLGNLHIHELVALGQNYQDFSTMKLNSCYFDRSPCDPNHVRLAASIMTGNCVLFNSSGKIRQNQVGPDFGLSMLFNINEDDSIAFDTVQSAGAGILVQISQEGTPTEYYTLKNKAIAASPGTLTKIKLKKREIRRLPHPYPDECIEKTTVNKMGQINFKFDLPYVTQWCRVACIWTLQMKFCGIIASQYRRIAKDIVDKERTHISFSNATNPDDIKKELECLHKASSSLNKNDEFCKCKPLCSEETYDARVSNVRWPTSNEAEILLKRMKNTWPNSSSIKNWTVESIYKNMAKIEIYFDDFNIERIEQVPAYGWNNFFSDFGGQAGLWIGASVYSIFELFSLCLMLIKKAGRALQREKEILRRTPEEIHEPAKET